MKRRNFLLSAVSVMAPKVPFVNHAVIQPVSEVLLLDEMTMTAPAIQIALNNVLYKGIGCFPTYYIVPKEYMEFFE